MAAVLAGCASGGEPAPVEFRNRAPISAPAEPMGSQTPARAPVELRAHAERAAAPVAPDTPSPAPDRDGADWAMRPGASLADFALRPEEARSFSPRSPPMTHRVQPGETLASVSALYQSPLRTLIETNSLQPPFALTPGQTLRIPRPLVHRVRAGETVLSLARTYSVDARSLALLNDLKPPYRIALGDDLVLPAGARARPEPSSAAPTTATTATTATAPPPAIERGAAGRFSWPLRGDIVGRFGPVGNGARRDGVDIAAPAGATFVAAAGGRVVYAGDDLPGYGRLILLQHDQGWVTAYARAGRLLVREGDLVTQGQQIGVVGVGREEPAGLHFQIRRGREARDPLRYLPSR